MNITSELCASINKYLFWNKARLDCFAQMIIALIRVRTVNLVDWSTAFTSKAKTESAYTRILRFFREYAINFDAIALMLFKWFDFDHKQIYLTLDRTQWQFGKKKINILMLGVVYKGIAVPLYWSLLNKKGNSNYSERVCLVDRFVEKFGSECIAGLLADREFIGKQWFRYLQRQKILCYIRIKQNMLISSSRGIMTNAMFLFSGLKRCEKRILKKKRKLSGCDLFIAGVRCPDGGYLIVATTEEPNNAIEIYRHRWEIETLFGCLKSRGFYFEETHMTDPNRLMKLIAVLAISFAWAHKVGEWHHLVKSIKIKKHGRKAESIFRYGFKKLRRLLLSVTKVRVIRKFIQILGAPPNQLGSIKLGVSL